MNAKTVDRLNMLSSDEVRMQFRRTCGSEWWCQQMSQERPFDSPQVVHQIADRIFDQMPHEAWLEAFASHPRIGDFKSRKLKFVGNLEWSGNEQAGTKSADETTLTQLASANDEYYQRFGWTFIVCATGRSALEMLALLEARLHHAPTAEFEIAAGEQRKITHLRLEKLTL